MGRLWVRAGTPSAFGVLATLLIGICVHKSMLGGAAASGSLLEQIGSFFFGPTQSDSDSRTIAIPRTVERGPVRVGGGKADAADTESLTAHAQLSFEERFASAFERYDQEDQAAAAEPASPPPASDLAGARERVTSAGQFGEAVRRAQLQSPAKMSARVAEALNDSGSMPEADRRTAIYDIAAHAVYLPNGDRLEAHSGLGSKIDDPRYISLKNRGPTPPNVYGLVLRKQRFHGVRAIRLIPVGEGQMFGRDGLLAHSYMLGRNGQSNGCVSFRDYPAFLNAFLKGEVERLVVVNHLATTPTAKSGSDSLWNVIKPGVGRISSPSHVDSSS